MATRVAVGSRDGLLVHQHFGRATHFQIYEIDGGEFKHIGVRENCPSCGSGDESADPHARVVDLLSDCQAVLVARIGPCAAAALHARGIKCWETQDFITISIRDLITSGALS
jgi:predicted Fe-Mo cluster-binding NifX family protein